MKPSYIILVLAALAAPLAVVMLGAESNETLSADISDVRVYTVTSGTVRESATAIGRLEADDVVDVSFLTGGQIDAVYVDEGDYVEAGEPLAVLANTPERVAVEQAALALETAEIQLEDTLTIDDDEIRIAEANVENARNGVGAAANAVRPEDIRAAELAYENALNAVDAADAAARAGGNLDAASRDILVAQLGQATFEAEQARLRVENTRQAGRPAVGAAAARLDAAEAELARLLAGPTTYEIEQAEITVEGAQVRLDQAELAFSRTRIEAPVSGFVTTVNVEPGERIGAGTPVMVITDIDPLLLVATVDEVDIRDVQPEMAALVEVDPLGNETFDGTVRRVAAQGTRETGVVNYEVKIDLDTLDPRVRPGMTAEAEIVLQAEADVLYVPNGFIQRDENGAEVVTRLRQDGTTETVRVGIGLRGNDDSAVTSGISAGDVLLLLPPDAA